jgi:SAM-dependent methyltransferase
MLQQHGARRVLDCNCGMGLRAILLQKMGFEMVGSDNSPFAIECAHSIADSLNLPIEFHHCVWHDLGEKFTEPFDAIINDAFAWTLSRTDLRFATHNFASILKPGGVLIFTGADQWTSGGDRAAMIDHAFQAAPRFQLRNDYEQEGTHLSLVVARDKTDIGVVENYLFVVRDSSGPRLETASICNSMQWTWEDFQNVCREAGFSSLESVKAPVGRREHILNVARK